jgi:hypothetical protein
MADQPAAAVPDSVARALIAKAVDVTAQLLERMGDEAMTQNPAEMAQALGRLVKSLDQLLKLDDRARGPDGQGASDKARELRARIKRRLDELALD